MQKNAILAAGCFWGVEDLIRKVPGVIDTEVGYTGGHTPNPTYNDVKTGLSGHAEAIQITYESNRIDFEKLLRLFFQLHDPTTLNRQGNDVGTQYRSAIFYQTEDERLCAQKLIASLNQSGAFTRPIATTLEPVKEFFPAESFHQDYLQKNPNGYTCHYWRKPYQE